MSEITKAIQAICDEKGLNSDAVLESIEAALAAAYRKDYGNRQQNIKVKFNPELGDMQAWDVKIVVEDIDEALLEEHQNILAERREKAREEDRELTEEEIADLVHFNPKTELMLKDAKEIKKDVKVGDILEIDLAIPGEFGRMAAQTAKQVIIQRLREAERSSVYDELKEQQGEVIQGVVQRRDKAGAIIIDLGKVTGIVPVNEQIRGEQYRPGSRMRFYLSSIEMGVRGVEIILSRASEKMVEAIFAQEIPEIDSGAVQIKGIAREAGHRSKVAVFTADESIDPIGACIGQRGSRINTIIEELGGEKIDIIQYSENVESYIKQALSPAKVDSVELNEDTKEAVVNVVSDQFSLAIGRGGQNVRLAANLSGWTIKVVEKGAEDKVVSSDDEVAVIEEKVGENIEAKEDVKKEEERKEE
ncbi:MAG TPA: transcription termination/antitermination protein NusA [Candidatus Magasanikbacteria bacterium]|nr:transcription termination/antitermination protein NusA [Candidatus Magasanikbacteria bacterium]